MSAYEYILSKYRRHIKPLVVYLQNGGRRGKNIRLNDHDFRQATGDFQVLVDEIMRDHKIDEIIESGTAQGDGSTAIFAQYNTPVQTIECNADFYEKAKQNLQNHSHVKVHHGFSLDREEMRAFIQNDKSFLLNPGENVYSDTWYPINFYRDEIDQEVEADKLLLPLIENEKRQLIFLDSAGGVGYLEFQKVMGLAPEFLKHKILLLDDVDHVKHYRSLQFLHKKGLKPRVSDDGRCCYCINLLKSE